MSSGSVLRVNISEVASFAAAAPTAGSAWIHVPVLDHPLPTLGQEVDSAQEANIYGLATPDYATGKSSAYSFSTRIHTGTKGGSGDTDPTIFYAKRNLESFHGMTAVEFEDTTLSGGTTSIPQFTGGVVGQAYGICASNSTSADDMDVVFATAVSGSSVTVDTAVANASSGNLVYGGFNLKPTLGARAAHHYINVELDGHAWLLGPGRFTGLNISGGAARQGLRYNFTYAGDTWATGVTPSSFADNSGSFSGAPLIGVGQMVYVNGTATRMADVSINFNVEHQEIPAVADSTSGANPNGRAGWEIVKAGASGEFTEYYLNTRWTQFTGRTTMPLKFVFRTGSTNAAKGRGTLAVYVPQAQVMVEPAVVNGQVSQKIKWTAVSPTPTQITNGLTSPYYLCVMGGA